MARVYYYVLFVFQIVLMALPVSAQTSIRGEIIDSVSREEVVGARVALKPGSRGAISKKDGSFIVARVPAGTYELTVSSLGYEPWKQTVIVADVDSMMVRVELTPTELEGEEVVVSGTRTERSVADVPIRVEAIPQEEIEEKLLMRPASVAMLLSESPGIRIQSTSASSNASNIRIQGLQGRYTQLLIDGVPSFTGLASGFGITQMIPLNLRQVEIVKGANSALYGPDAIAGIVNFITKDPREKPELTALLNLTSQKGIDVSGFYSEKFDPIGVTALASYNRQARFDVDGDGFSDLAEYTRVSLAPKLRYDVSESLSLMLSGEYFGEKRLGGSMSASEAEIANPSVYLERTRTDRLNLTTVLTQQIGESDQLQIRAAGMRLARTSDYGPERIEGDQSFNLADAQYSSAIGDHRLLFGASYTSEAFQQDKPVRGNDLSYSYQDLGGWLQDEWSLSELWRALGSVRVDHELAFGTFVTPRASLMFRPASTLTFRLGAGTGFKMPTVFLEESEAYGLNNTLPLRDVKVEQARSATFDVNYRFVLGDAGIKMNLALYQTELDDALKADEDSLARNLVFIRNATGLTRTRGGEFTTQVGLGDLTLTLSYAYVFAEQEDRGERDELELNPHHWLGIILMYENEEIGVKAGLENYYVSPQHLYRYPGRTMSPDYSLTGFLIEKAFGPVRLFLNAENIFDIRQTRFGSTYLGTPGTTDFRPLPIFAPLEGRAFNGGVRVVM